MKKINLFCAVVAISMTATSAIAQAVRDRNMVPVAVNLNQVLRMNVTKGGNIDFTFSTINDYKSGMGSSGTLSATSGTLAGNTENTNTVMYQTDFTIASSVRWTLMYGADNSSFIGSDGNTLDLNNVGFSLTASGSYVVGTNYDSPLCTTFDTEVQALDAFGTTGVTLIQDAPALSAGNGGDGNDNDFHLFWQCGTAETTNSGLNTMNPTTIIQQTQVRPDHYVTNVLFELIAD